MDENLNQPVADYRKRDWGESVIKVLDKVGVFSRWTNIIGIAFLFFMILVTVVDVVMRYIFNRPIFGVYELTGIMMIIAIFLSISHTQNQKSHVSIDIITAKLSAKARLVTEFITTLLSLIIFSIIVWRTFEQTMFLASQHTQQGQILPIPAAPFAAVIVLGCTTLFLLLVRDLLTIISNCIKTGLNQIHWTLMGIVPVLVITVIIFWMQPDLWQISLPTVGLISVLFSLVLFFAGMPISFSLILTSFIFTAHIRGGNTALDMLGTEIYRNAGSYSWSVLPFFVLMGFFCLHAKFGEDLFHTAYKWFGHLRGGMALATVGACTGFAAIVGDSVAATATMGAVALPQMRKYKYNDNLSTGSIVGGATLGPIIPPSVLFIIFGLLTNVSIASMFIGGILPGLLIAVIFCLIIIVWCRINPNLGPGGERSSWKQRFISLKSTGSVLILFFLVIGGIYTGVFTPTEGGAIGAAGAFIIGLIMRRWTFRSFSNALLEAGKTVSMVFLILIGGLMFSRFAAWCNLSGSVTNLIATLGLSSSLFMILLFFVFLILGCVMDTNALLIIGVPILFPVVLSLGINPIFFGVFISITMAMGSLTPPVGINLFVLKGIYREINIGTIYRGSIPFSLGMILACIILLFVPAIVTWLPNLME